MDLPKLFEDDFSPVMSAFATKFVGSVTETIGTNSFKLSLKHTRAVLSSDEISGLSSLLHSLNNIPESAVLDMKFTSITFKGKTFSSAGKSSKPDHRQPTLAFRQPVVPTS
jgi:hypothetical protein